jgi:hypothetical protein
MTNICNDIVGGHKFFELDRINKPDPDSPAQPGTIGGIHRSIFGVKVVCATCGEVRHLWPDGTVEVVIKGREKTPEHDPHA